ncbi:hypothetical protein GWL_41990 [Herbaspirillum sp. GW103]|nr:hypothetical protein GWL_41990 [Herbaspirillum sp. GW103]
MGRGDGGAWREVWWHVLSPMGVRWALPAWGRAPHVPVGPARRLS